MTDGSYGCIFSIVMAVYNCEPFLRETLDSILNQNIAGITRFENGVQTDEPLSFEELCEVIMVDDGSTDSSGKICDEYAEKYANFKVIHKKNDGVASARNEGLSHVRGKYMNFLDSDDLFSPGVFREIYCFFERNYEKTDVVTMPLKFFDAASGDHWQNYKFKKNARIAELYNEYDTPLMFVNASFFKSEYKDRVRFCDRLVCGEDIRYICEILADKMTMGLVPYCHYLYRRRSAGEESLVESSKKKLGWYFDYFEHLTEWGVDFCRKKWGYMPYYYQNILVCDLQWRFLNEYEETALRLLGEESYGEYKKRLYSVLGHFDDKIILGQRNIKNEHKCMMLTKKYGTPPKRCVYHDDVRLRLENTMFCWLSSCYTLIDFIRIENGRLIIEGYTTLLGCTEEDKVEVCLEIHSSDGIKYLPTAPVTNRVAQTKRLGEVLYPAFPFLAECELSELEAAKINLAVFLNGSRIIKKDIRFGRFSPIGKEYGHSYYSKDGYAVTVDGYSLLVKKISRKDEKKALKLFMKELRTSEKASDKKAYFALKLARILFHFKRKKIWLISDREREAGDNGERLFEHLNNNGIRGVKAYFVISEESKDFGRLQMLGRTVPCGSHMHKLLYLLSDAIITSHTDDELIFPFKEYFAPYRRVISEKKTVFLQHGVTKDDVSRWFSKYKINAQGFITSSESERKSIIDGSYGYSEREVWLTGMPRFDNMGGVPKKIIAVIPTWRAYLLTGWGLKPISDERFVSSEYFKFYKELFSDERLREALAEHGYEMRMKPHYRMTPYMHLFKEYGIEVFDGTLGYSEILSESSLLLTDYSSVAFDFAYLRKAMIYAQFDRDEFFSGSHSYVKGYFDYDANGFGEVTEDVGSTVNAIIGCIEQNCKPSEKYLSRIDGFFAFSDKSNTERVVERLLDL